MIKKLIPFFVLSLVLVYGSCVWAQPPDYSSDSHQISFDITEGVWLVVNQAITDLGEIAQLHVMISEYGKYEYGDDKVDGYGNIVAIGQIEAEILYTSILPDADTSRTILMEIDDDPLDGLRLMVTTAADSLGYDDESKGGTNGSLVSTDARAITAATPLTLVSGIGSVELAQLFVDLTVDIVDMGRLRADASKTINATYTLTAD